MAGPCSATCHSLTLLSLEPVTRWRSVTHASPKSQSKCPCMSQTSSMPGHPTCGGHCSTATHISAVYQRKRAGPIPSALLTLSTDGRYNRGY